MSEPRDFREAAALLADMALHLEVIVARPGSDPMSEVRMRLEDARKSVERCGFTLVELYHFLYLYIGMSEAEMRAELLRYERLERRKP